MFTNKLLDTQPLVHTTSSLLDPSYTVILREVTRLSQFFEQTCNRLPNAIALVCGSAQLTYRQLDRRANQLAHLLRLRGLREGQTVGIYIERSTYIYVALLAVLKAGGAFVPLDPSFPADRVAFIAEDASLQDLLTTTAMREKTSELPCRVLELDEAQRALALQSPASPYVHVAADSLCYIIYTSGTTGKPKGVGVTHANIANFLSVVMPIYDVQITDRVYQGMSIAFDFSFEEIWPTWIAGATLIAGPTDSRRLGHGLTEFLIERQISVFCCVPTLLATIDQDVSRLASTLVAGSLFVFSVCALVLASKRLIMPAARPGIYSARSGFGVRK